MTDEADAVYAPLRIQPIGVRSCATGVTRLKTVCNPSWVIAERSVLIFLGRATPVARELAATGGPEILNCIMR